MKTNEVSFAKNIKKTLNPNNPLGRHSGLRRNDAAFANGPSGLNNATACGLAMKTASRLCEEAKPTKQSRDFFRRLLSALGLTVAFLAAPSAYASVAGYVQFVNGNVQITSPTGQVRPAQKGDAINEGDTLTSAQKSSVQVKMQDGGFVAVRPDTQLKFDQFVFAGKEDGSEKSFYSLFKGGFRAVTGLIGRINKQNYKITTPAATIGIRGTDHETFLITPDSPLAQVAPPGAYNKVNVGETYVATDKGTIFVLPNQMGYAGGMDQMPRVQPVNTKVFTVAEAATPEAKAEKKEEKEEKAEAKQEEKVAKGDKEEKKEEAKAEEAVAETTPATATQEEVAPVRETAVVDATAPTTGGAPAAVAPTVTTTTTAVVAPPPAPTTVINTAPVAGGTTVNIVTGTATTSTGQTIPVTQSLYATQAQAAADAALTAANAAQAAATATTADNTMLAALTLVDVAPATTEIDTATTGIGAADTAVTAATALTADSTTAAANAATAQTAADAAATQAAAAQAALTANGAFADSTAGPANTAVQTANGEVQTANATVQAAATDVAAQNAVLGTAQSAASTALTSANTNLATASTSLTAANTQNAAITAAQGAIATQVTDAQTAAANAQVAATAAQTAATQAAALQAAGDLAGAQAQLLIAQQELAYAQQQLALAQAAQTTVASQLAAAQSAQTAASTAVTTAVQTAILAADAAATASAEAAAAQTAASAAASALVQTDSAPVSTQVAIVAANAPVAAYNNPAVATPDRFVGIMSTIQPNATSGYIEGYGPGAGFTGTGTANTSLVLDGNGNLVEQRHTWYEETPASTATPQVEVPDANVKRTGGTALETFKMADNSIYAGRWVGGSLTITDNALTNTVPTFTRNLGVTSEHWAILLAPPSGYVQTLGGTVTYNKVAATSPTDALGNAGTLNTATLTANFTSQIVDAALNLTIASKTLDVTAANMAINGSFFSTATQVTAGCTGTGCAGTYYADVGGGFAGDAAASAGLTYTLWTGAAPGVNAGATDLIQGIAAFSAASDPVVAPTATVQPYVQTDVSFEFSANDGYYAHSPFYSFYFGDHMTAAGNFAPAANPPSFAWDYDCVGCPSYIVQLPGATGPVNGNATSFATTGIQFGRWTNVPAISQTFTSTFGPGQVNTNTGSSWAYAPQGYLDAPTVLSAATGGTVQGVFNYVLNGTALAPTDQYGTAGTLNSLSLAANFTTQTISAALSASLGTTTWTANSGAMAVNGTTAGFNGSLTVASSNPSVNTGGYLGGAFTGQNYAGAIVSYYINEWPLVGGTTTYISGVAALTRNGVVGNATVANGTAAPTGKFVVAQGYWGSLQTADTVTASAGVLTGYTYTDPYNNMFTSTTTIACTTCSGQAAPDTATGIQFGTWDAGSRTYNYDWTFGGQFHWIQGPGLDPIYLPEVLLGTMDYTLDGGTAPTNQNGLTGTLSGASLAVDFTSQTVNIALGLTGVNGHDWTASSVGAPLNWTNHSKNGFWASNGTTTGALNVTMDGATAGSGYISGQLTGSGLNGALFQYNLNAPLPMPTVPATSTATDTVTVQAPSVTMTECCTSGGPLTATFPAGTGGTLVLQPATTLDLTWTAGAPTSATLSGGVNDSVTLTPHAVLADSYGGASTATPGYAIEVDTMGFMVTGSGVAGGLKYSNFGEWRKFPAPAGTFPASTTGAFTNGFYAGGSLPTSAASMTTAYYGAYTSYSGYQTGGAQDSTTNTPYKLGGTVSLNANLVTGTLTGTMSNINVADAGTSVGYFNDLSLSATITTNAFSGSVTANAAPAGLTASPVNVPVGTAGTTSGHFYGPNANELTGIWQLASGTIMAAGSFGAANGTSNMAPMESVNGTVALVAATPADVATPYRLVGLSAFDPVALANPTMYSDGGMVVDGGFNNVTRVTEVAGGVTAFDSGFGSDYYYTTYHDSARLDIGTATAAGLGTDPATGISWGRWDGGSIDITDRTTGVVTPVTLGAGSLHWIAAPSMTAPVALPVSGVYAYNKVGGTVPTDNLSNVGTLNSASLVANFTNQTIDVGVNVGISNATGATTLIANGTGIPIQQRAMFDAATANVMGGSSAGLLTATCTGAGCGASSSQARISGAFTGATGAGAAMLYGFTNNGNVVSGVAAFQQGTAIPQ